MREREGKMKGSELEDGKGIGWEGEGEGNITLNDVEEMRQDEIDDKNLLILSVSLMIST